MLATIGENALAFDLLLFGSVTAYLCVLHKRSRRARRR